MPVLVAPEVARAKFEREVAQLEELAPLLAARGLLVIDRAFPWLRVLFSFPGVPVAVPFRVDLDYSNYDIIPPSVRFVHPITGEPLPPQVLPPMLQLQPDGAERSLLVGGHPDTGLPFVCLPGIREYHTHPEHTGDSWDLYRCRGDGRMFVLLDRIWTYAISPVKQVQMLVLAQRPGLAQPEAPQSEDGDRGE